MPPSTATRSASFGVTRYDSTVDSSRGGTFRGVRAVVVLVDAAISSFVSGGSPRLRAARHTTVLVAASTNQGAGPQLRSRYGRVGGADVVRVRTRERSGSES